MVMGECFGAVCLTMRTFLYYKANPPLSTGMTKSTPGPSRATYEEYNKGHSLPYQSNHKSSFRNRESKFLYRPKPKQCKIIFHRVVLVQQAQVLRQFHRGLPVDSISLQQAKTFCYPRHMYIDRANELRR
jgi:hypothetical protein